MASGNITIRILGGTSDGGNGDGGGGEREKSPGQITYDSLRKLMHPLKTVGGEAMDLFSGSSASIAALGITGMVLKNATSTMYSFAMMEHNRYFTLREDYLAQNKMTQIQTQLNTAKNIGGSVISGALSGGAAGMAAGPVGVAVGATLGIISSTATTLTKMQSEKAQKIEQYNMQLNATNAQMNFAASRASLVNGGRGTEY